MGSIIPLAVNPGFDSIMPRQATEELKETPAEWVEPLEKRGEKNGSKS